MKLKNIIYIGIGVIGCVACDRFLDETPDNRTTLDTDQKIKKILVSAYPSVHYGLSAELSSDNTDDQGTHNPEYRELYRQFAYWEHSTEEGYDALGSVWAAHYSAIANANEALKAIQEQGNPQRLNPFRGEALIARAYAHFALVNLFCNHYNPTTSATDLGIPYMEAAETKLLPRYERGNVKDVYQKIEKDLQEALPLIDDASYEVPKYHFNRAASYAFAARFYLFYQKWDKALQYANLVLGTNPQNALRNWEEMEALPKNPTSVGTLHYTSADRKSNLLILAYNSYQGAIFAPSIFCARFPHSSAIATSETLLVDGVWGRTSQTRYKYQLNERNDGNIDKTLISKIHYATDYVDRIAGTGYIKSVLPIFTIDETLLVRAEASIMLKDYDQAVGDLNLWAKNIFKSVTDFTQSQIEAFYERLPYDTDDFPSSKKKLNPSFTIDTTQENMLHCLLHCRRIETLHEGLRWFDIRRYGIEIKRYITDNTRTRKVADALKLGDPRRTLQLPADVISAGMQPNPR